MDACGSVSTIFLIQIKKKGDKKKRYEEKRKKERKKERKNDRQTDRQNDRSSYSEEGFGGKNKLHFISNYMGWFGVKRLRKSDPK